MKKKTVKEVKMHKFLVCAYKSQDFAQSLENYARSHDRDTVTFRNSAYSMDSFVGLKRVQEHAHKKQSYCVRKRIHVTVPLSSVFGILLTPLKSGTNIK